MVDTMIRLLESTATSFDEVGICVLSDAISCEVIEERNGEFELEMRYPIEGRGYADIRLRRFIVAKPNPFADPQPFRIYSISKPINGIVTVMAEHISYDLSGYVVSPFTADSLATSLVAIKRNSVEPCPFDFTTDKNVASTMEVAKPRSIRSLLGGSEGSLLDIYGKGEYEFNRYDVKLWLNRGLNRGVTVRYGKNLTDLEQEENCSSVYTAVYPYWYSDEDGLVTLDDFIVNVPGTYDYTRILPLDLSDKWQDPPTQATLRQAAQAYISDNNIGVPKVSLKVSFVELSQSEEYKDYALLETVHLCDTVNVEFPKLGVSATSKCIKTTYNALTGKYTSIELGESSTKLSETIAEQQIAVNKNPVETSIFKTAVANATKLITGGLGGYVVLHSSTGEDTPDEILVMDQPTVEAAINVWRWNKNGLGHSNTGYNGEFGLAMTYDGKIVADRITAGTMRADRVRAGLLVDETGTNYWNLDTGEFRLTWNASVGDSTLENGISKKTRQILDNANAYGLGWKVNASTFSNTNNGECYYHGYSTDGTASDVDGWVYWNGEKITIPKGCKINPNETMLFDTTTYSVYRTSDQTFHDVQWNPTTKRWVANTYSGTTPSARAVWTWDESTDIVLASYSLAAAESAIYAAQLFTPPRKYSDLPGVVQETLEQQISDFTTTINAEIADIQEQLDDEVDTWYYDYAPTLSNYPASEWTTEALRAEHQGDMFLDTSTGYAYRFISNNKISQPYGEGTHTDHGITFTLNADGSVTANGTASGNAEFAFKGKVSLYTLPAGSYTINQPNGASGSKWRFRIDGYLNNAYKKSYVSGAATSITIGASDQFDSLQCVLIVYSGQTVTNLTFKPTIVPQGDDGWIWLPISDSAATQALQIASEAKDTADHKRRVFISTPYTPYDQGDIWMQGTDGDILVCLESRTSEETYDLTDWGKLNKYTDEATTLNIVDSQIADIRVGGRNLLLKTGESKTCSNAISAGSFTTFDPYYMVLPYNELGLTADDSVTLSFDWKAENIPSGTITVRVGTNTSPYEYFGVFATITVSTNSGHFEQTYKVTSTLAGSTGSMLRFRIDSSVAISSGTFKFTVSNAKLEIGTKATAFTVAPEDVAEDIVNVYVKSGGRNYLVGTGKPFERAFLSEAGSYETNHVSGTYQYQTLSDLGFKSDDTATLSFDWEEELINLIPYPYSHTTRTVNGITFTDNGDGTVTANGTATAQASFNLRSNGSGGEGLSLGAGTYHLTGCPSGGSSTTYQIYVNNYDTASHAVGNDFGSGLDFAVSDDSLTYGFYVQIQSGATVNNLTFTPKLVCTSARGTFRFEGYRTDGTNYTYAANLLTGAGLSGNVVTPTETAMSGHVSSTLAMTSALLNVGDVHIRADGVKGIIRISNLKLEKGEVSTAWTAAPEDASIASPGINMIRGTNTFTTIGTASAWSDGTFRPTNYSAANGTNTPIGVSDILVQKIFRGVESKCTTPYNNGWTNSVSIVQVNIPNAESRKAYTISCYAKGSGVLQFGVYAGSGLIKRVFLNNITTWTRYSFNFIMPPGTNFTSAQNRTSVVFGVVGLSTIQICGMKLEEGITATEWSQAPEDTEDAVKAKYGTCSTAAGTVAKAVTLSNFALYTGARISVYFTNANTAIAPTLNVNGTGAKPIWAYGATLAAFSPYNWEAKSTVEFVYDGSHWIMADSAALQRLQNFISGTYQIDKEDLESQLDKKIETWYQSGDPSTDWTAEDKLLHTGDLWHKTSDNKEYRWSGSAWVEQPAPNEIFTRIDKKTSIYYGTTSGTYQDVSVGDYLVDSSNGSTYRWSGSRWIKETDYVTAISTAVSNYDTNLNQQKVFNKLTNNGAAQGIYMQGSNLYINGSYIAGGTFKAGGSNNTNGVIEVFDASGNRVGRWDNQAMYVGNIASNLTNPNFYLNANGNLRLKRLDVTGIYSQGNVSFYATDTANGGVYSNANIYAAGQLSANKIYARDSAYLNDVYASVEYAYPKVYFHNTIDTWGAVFASETSAFYKGVNITGGLYVDGDIYATGGVGAGSGKPRLIATKDYGERYLYCYETPTPHFGDIGDGVISEDGKCFVEIDNVFASTVSLMQYQVFLQKYGEGDCWVSEKTGAYFVVEGTPELSFGWEIKAKQFDLDQIRINKNDSDLKIRNTVDYAKELDEHLQIIRHERRTA